MKKLMIGALALSLACIPGDKDGPACYGGKDLSIGRVFLGHPKRRANHSETSYEYKMKIRTYLLSPPRQARQAPVLSSAQATSTG